MARRQVLTVRPRPDLKRNRLYRARVQRIHIDRKNRILDVTVEHIEKGQAGRMHSFRFDLPLYPESPASRFLAAFGLDASRVGNDVCVDDAVGTIVGMRFPAGDFGEADVTFERVPQTPDDADNSAGAQHLPSTSQHHGTLSRKDLP